MKGHNGSVPIYSLVICNVLVCQIQCKYFYVVSNIMNQILVQILSILCRILCKCNNDSTLVSRAKGSRPGKWHQKRRLQDYKKLVYFWSFWSNDLEGKTTPKNTLAKGIRWNFVGDCWNATTKREKKQTKDCFVSLERIQKRRTVFWFGVVTKVW